MEDAVVVAVELSSGIEGIERFPLYAGLFSSIDTQHVHLDRLLPHFYPVRLIMVDEGM
jgi:hypothetical protein